MLAKITVLIIDIYQKTLSPDHGLFRSQYPYGFCPYYPSCSQYSKESLLKYGFVKGLSLSLYRIFRCNPWANPSIDKII